MRSLYISLEARAPERDCFRAYRIAAGKDLFGAWLVEMTYGRIGTSGRTKARSFNNLDAAAAEVRSCLRRRATAPQRIGTAYVLMAIERAAEWPKDQLVLPET